MSDHEVTIVHTPLAGGCVYTGVCTCFAVSETIVSEHTPADPEACGRVRRSLYQWELEHGEGESGGHP